MTHSTDKSRRSRLTLAVAVAAACFAMASAIPTLVTPPAAAPTHAESARVGTARAGPVARDPHAPNPGTSGQTERRLREIETLTLGPAHAREHAMLRRALRRRAAGAQPEATPLRLARAAAEPLDAAEVGRWDASATVTLPIIAIHAAMLPTGKVMVFSFPKSPYQNTAQVWLWDPRTGHLDRRDPPPFVDPIDGQLKPANIWCAGHTFTADGELVVFGGNLDFANEQHDYKGLNKVYSFNPFTETWREQPDMRHGRWYPSGVRMPDGRIPILSGWDESGTKAMNTDVELFTPAAELGGLGSTTLIGGTGGAGQPPTGEYYPHMFSMPSGRALVVGPDAGNTWFFDSIGTNSFTWSDYPDLSRRRIWGTAVPIPNAPRKIMALGGTDWSVHPSTKTTEVFDESNPGLGWQPATPNLIGRGHANTVLLPDGSMVQVGGGIGTKADAPSPHHYALPEQRQIELWDPATGDWRLGPAQAESRAYHSTALLLPDGRVMSAGDDWNGGIENDTAEIYEPPYLFRGPRPTITSAPQTIRTGATFGVQTPNGNIQRAALIAPSAVTHAVDMNQRFVPLQVTRRDGCVDLTVPSNTGAAPPGYYMLFLLNDQGVPSVARFVKLETGGTASPCSAPPPPPDTAAPSVTVTAPSGGTVSGGVELKATAEDNVGVAGVRFRLDGANLGPEDTSPPYSTSWNTTTVPNGAHTLTAVARDGAGNSGTSAPVTVTVANTAPDTTPPSVSLTAPAHGATVSGSATVTAQASDERGVEAVQFQLDGDDLGPEDTTAPYSVPWNTTDVANGIHELAAIARDTAGNVSTPATRTVIVANSPPPVEPAPVEPGPGARPVTPAPRGGGGSAASPPAAPPDAAPTISNLKLSRRAFRRVTTVSFRLNEQARVTLSLERSLAGRRVRGRCVPPGRRRRPSCTRHVRLGPAVTLQASAGANSMALRPRRSPGRGAPPGRYRLTVLATDPGGRRSAPARTTFRLLSSAKPRPRAPRLSLITGLIGKLGLPAAASDEWSS